MFGGASQAPTVGNRAAFAYTPFSTAPPFAVDDYRGPPVLQGSPYGRMTYWGLVGPEERANQQAAGQRKSQSTALTTTGNSGAGLGDALSRPASSSKLVSSDLGPLPGPAPAVYRNKPPLLFHSPQTAPMIAFPSPVQSMVPSSAGGMNMSLTAPGGLDFASQARPGSAHQAVSGVTTSSMSATTPRAPAVLPTNGQTFNIFYSDGLSEKDQQLRNKMEARARAVEVQQANAIQMDSHGKVKAVLQQQQKEQERLEEEKVRRERERIAQKEMDEMAREEAERQGKVYGTSDPTPAGPSILVKTPKKALSGESGGSAGNLSNSPDRSWLSQPVPILAKKEVPRPATSLAPRPATSPSISPIDLRPIDLHLPPKDFPLSAPRGGGLPKATVAFATSPPRSLTPMSAALPFDTDHVLRSQLTQISRDQQRMVQLLEQQVASGRSLSPSIGRASGARSPSSATRKRGAGTFLTDGLRMPAGNNGLSSLLSASHLPKETHVETNITTSYSSNKPQSPLFSAKAKTTPTTAGTYLTDPAVAPPKVNLSLGDGPGSPVGLPPILPLSSNISFSQHQVSSTVPPPPPILQGKQPQSSTDKLPPLTASISKLTDMWGSPSASTKAPLSFMNQSVTANDWMASRPGRDPDDLSIEPSQFVRAF